MHIEPESLTKPLRKLRKTLKGFPKQLPPKLVHDVRTRALRVEAILKALHAPDEVTGEASAQEHPGDRFNGRMYKDRPSSTCIKVLMRTEPTAVLRNSNEDPGRLAQVAGARASARIKSTGFRCAADKPVPRAARCQAGGGSARGS
jgi:hypothetical protein